jgi:D-beta-D-heptose 7-phosphate kinase/D-beta-D-heptose 1-phosphate adenosyltransferase
VTLAIPSFQGLRIAVTGDVMVDHYWYGDASRISPEAPVPVVRISGSERRAGGAANVARNVAALGATAVLYGVVGEDEQADSLRQSLAQAGVECALHQATGFGTISKTRVISKRQQLLRLDRETPVPAAAAQALLERLRAGVDGCDLLVLSDYGKGSLERVQEMVALARQRGMPVLVDPKGRDFARYRGATLITPNRSEFEAVAGPCHDDEDFAREGQRVARELELDAILVTRGEQGMSLVPRFGDAVHLSARAREVFDVTGAGDTVIACLGCALAAGVAGDDAARIANLAAGLVVSRFGAATVSRAQLIGELESAAPQSTGMLSLSETLEAIAGARSRGERIVMTNGCFDLLHAGHVSYLREARRLGDRLLVAINADSSVTRLKGSGRPLNTAAARAAVLSALSMVDWVVEFAEDTPERLIVQVLPDVLVKGGDYVPEDIVGADAVRAAGGQVHALGYVEGFSTSELLARSRGAAS